MKIQFNSQLKPINSFFISFTLLEHEGSFYGSENKKQISIKSRAFFITRTKQKNHKLKMSCKLCFITIVLISLSVGIFSQTCEDSRCKTGLCNSDGSCICNLPKPSTILDGDRPFMGGKFCDVEMIMCDGSDSFWCQNGGKCEEIVQGEIYKCKCKPGFGGEHCESKGTECGESYCFNGAECLVEEGICDCPSNLKGSFDCSLPTVYSSESSGNGTVTRSYQSRSEKSSNFSTFIAVVLALSGTAGVVVGCVMYEKRTHNRKTDLSKFQELQMQHHGILSSDEDEVNHALVRNDNSHI